MNSQQIPVINEQIHSTQQDSYNQYIAAAQQQHQQHILAQQQQQARQQARMSAAGITNGLSGNSNLLGQNATNGSLANRNAAQNNSHMIGFNIQQLRNESSTNQQNNTQQIPQQNQHPEDVIQGRASSQAQQITNANGIANSTFSSNFNDGHQVQVTHLHHAQGIAGGIGQLGGVVSGQGLSQHGAQIIASQNPQNINAIMSQIGGISYQAAQAQAHAQAQAIANQSGQPGAQITRNQVNIRQVNQLNSMNQPQVQAQGNQPNVHHLGNSHAQRVQQIAGSLGQMGQITHIGQLGQIGQIAQIQGGHQIRDIGQLHQQIQGLTLNQQTAAVQQQYQYNRQMQQLQQMQQYGSEVDDSDELDSENDIIQGKNPKNGQYNSEEDEFEFPKLIPIRASTAPPRPLTEIEEFRRSSDFLLLENTVMMSDHLKQRPDEKYDLDSEDGQRACKRFLNQIERLCERFKAICATRRYREQFSKAYKVLYKEGSLCYLTEILDSAQEGFPYLWVNGEKYVFSQDVLEAGRKLFQQFKMIQQIIRNIYERIMEEVNITVQDVLEDMGKNLQEFDHTWVAYEQIYVLELMLIEADARRFITEAIETEKELTQIEKREKGRGKIANDNNEYNNKRAKLIQILGKINSVANPEGMGRDDLSNDILLAAEGIFRRVSPHQSKAVRALADRIKKAFLDFRNLLKKYEQNIEVVDPQLKNNVELVDILVEFENTWTQGLTYFMDHKKCHQLIHFSSVIEATGEKHKSFEEQLESREAEIFVIIPSLLILKSLEGDDKDICSFFNPDMFDKQSSQAGQLKKLRGNYEQGRNKMGSMFDYYNLIEKCLLEVPLSDKEKINENEYDVQNKIIKEIKGLAMCLSRFKPADWNKFLDVVIK